MARVMKHILLSCLVSGLFGAVIAAKPAHAQNIAESAAECRDTMAVTAAEMAKMQPMPSMDSKVPMPTPKAAGGMKKDSVMQEAAKTKACMDPMLRAEEATIDSKTTK
jgi:hypothetical protein